MSSPLANFFPEKGHQHQMGFQRGDFAQFFSPTKDHGKIVGERQHWLGQEPDKYAALLPQGTALLEETLSLASVHQTLLPEETAAIAGQNSLWDKCLALGRSWEPDFLLLHREADGVFRLAAGVVCFPSSWSLEETIGQPLESIHAAVPDLNPQLGRQIHTFLSRLRPDAVWLRTNWGLSASPELNQHPSRGLPHLRADFAPEAIWLRIEHQALAALPKTSGVLFGIRIHMHPLAEVKADHEAKERLANSLQTMSEEIADYKRLTQGRANLIQWLRH